MYGIAEQLPYLPQLPTTGRLARGQPVSGDGQQPDGRFPDTGRSSLAGNVPGHTVAKPDPLRTGEQY